MALTQITSHVADARARAMEMYRGKPNLQALLGIFAGCGQVLENQAYPLLSQRFLFGSTASGAQLDVVGQLVGLARNGLDDDTYRLFILGTIAQNNSTADNESLLSIVRLCFRAKQANIVSCFSPGHSHSRAPAVVGIEVGSPALPSTLWPLVIGILQKAIGAGVTLSWVSVYDASQAFALDGQAGGMGLGDAAISGSGGMLATMIYNNPAN